MEVHFHPAISFASEKYGDAVLSRLPMRLKRAAELPGKTLVLGSEPRGAVWVEVDVGDSTVQVFNTHLGLRPRERQEQIDALLGTDWAGHPDCKGPVVFCGDFNAGPRSYVYRSIGQRFQDTQLCANRKRPVSTWLSTWPVLRIDHVFVSRDVEVAAAMVPRSMLMRVASDHLPLVVDLMVEQKERREQESTESAFAKANG
jgi:endonuclease/exonuclease/phosphatase family metal-dependent hydrolase